MKEKEFGKTKASLNELNKIIAEEMKPQWYWMCLFCGKHSSNGETMKKHVEKHFREIAKKDDSEEYGMLEGEWEDHTITVEPNIDGLRAGYVYAGFRPYVLEG